jgi:hypothetical protein
MSSLNQRNLRTNWVFSNNYSQYNQRPNFRLPNWLNDLRMSNPPEFSNYENTFFQLMEYCIGNNKFKVPSSLLQNGNSIYRATHTRDYNINTHTFIPIRTGATRNDQPIWFAKRPENAQQYIHQQPQSDMAVLTRRFISDDYVERIDNNREQGINIFLSLDNINSRILCPNIQSDYLYNFDINLTRGLMRLVRIKMNYLRQINNNMVRLDPQISGEPEANIPIDTFNNAFDNYRYSIYNIDRVIVYHWMEIFGIMESWLREQPVHILHPRIIEAGHLVGNVRVHILGYSETDKQWLPSINYPPCSMFTAEVTIRGRFFLNQNLVFLLPPTSNSVRILPGTDANNNIVNVITRVVEGGKNPRDKNIQIGKIGEENIPTYKNNIVVGKNNIQLDTSKEELITIKEFTDEIYDKIFIVNKSDIQTSITLTPFQEVLYNIGKAQREEITGTKTQTQTDFDRILTQKQPISVGAGNNKYKRNNKTKKQKKRNKTKKQNKKTKKQNKKQNKKNKKNV